MSDFFNQEQLNNITLKDVNTESVKDFSRANLNTPLGSLPQYEDLYKKEIVPQQTIEFSKLQEISPIKDREFKKQEDKEKAIIRARVKIFLTMFVLITLVVTGFVIYNLIAMVSLNNKIENNDIKIKSKREQIEREEEQPVNVVKELENLSQVEIIVNI